MLEKANDIIALSDNADVEIIKPDGSNQSGIKIDLHDFVFSSDYARDGSDLIASKDGEVIVIEDYFLNDEPADLISPEGAVLQGSVVKILAGPLAPGVYAQEGDVAGAAPIGQVETLEGAATVQRVDGTVEPLNVGTKVFQNDVVQTTDGSTISITFLDKTIFTLSANSRMVLSELVYTPEGEDNSSVFNLVEGSFVFIAGQVAKTGDMQVKTPVATMGIRGTTVKVKIESNADGEATVTISLNRDEDGTLGQFQILDLAGDVIANVTLDTGKWVVTPTAEGSQAQEIPRSAEEIAVDLAIINQAFEAANSADARIEAGEQAVEPDAPSNEENEDQQQDQESEEEGEENAEVEASDDAEEQAQEDTEAEANEEGDVDAEIEASEEDNSETGDEPQGNEPTDTGNDAQDGSDGDVGDQSALGSGIETETISDSFLSQIVSIIEETDDNITDLEGGDITVEFEGGDTSETEVEIIEILEDDEPEPDVVAEPDPTFADLSFNGSPTVNEDSSPISLGGFGLSTNASVVDATLIAGSTISIPTIAGITILPGSVESQEHLGSDPTEYDTLIISGSPEAIEQALNGARYRPSTDADVEGTLQIIIEDDLGDVLYNETLSVDIIAQEDDPTFTSSVANADEDGSAINVDLSQLGDDVDTGDTLTYSATPLATGSGSVSINGSTLTFDPGNDFQDLDIGDTQQVVINVTVTDSTNRTASGTITVTVTGTDSAPVANVDQNIINEDAVSFVGDLFDNDMGAVEGDVLTLASVSIDGTPITVGVETSLSAGGTVTFASDGTFTFTAAGDFDDLQTGDSFTHTILYTLQSSNGDTAMASHDLVINGVNDAPSGIDENGSLGTIFEANGLLSSDIAQIAFDDPDGGAASVEITPNTNNNPAFNVNFTDTFVDNGGTRDVIEFRATINGSELDSLSEGQTVNLQFTIGVNDGNGGVTNSPVNYTLTLSGVNDIPVVPAPLTAGGNEGSAAFSLDMLAGASDVDANDTLLVDGASVTGLIPGISFVGTSLNVDPSSSAFEALGDGETAVATVNYNIIDGNGGTVPQTATITITGTNDDPVISGDLSIAVNEANSVMLTTADITASDIDNPLGELTFTVTGVTNGEVRKDGTVSNTFTFGDLSAGEVTFVHDGSETASGSISVTVDDGEGGSVSTTINVGVTSENDDPVISGDLSITVAEGDEVILTSADLGGSDVDNVDGDLSFSIGDISGGSIVVNESTVTSFTLAQLNAGDVTYVHDGSEGASHSIELTLADGSEGTDTALINVAVTGSNDDPVISGDLAISVDEGGSVMLTAADLDASDVDNLDGDLTFTVTNVNNGGILVSGNPANTFTLADITAGNVAYVHDGSEATSASITLTVDDGVGGSATNTITATVTPENDDPVISGDLSITVAEGDEVILTSADLGGSDVDNVDGDLSFSIGDISGGSIVVNESIVTSFTLAQLNAGDVTYVHDGSEGASHSIELTLADGSEGTDTALINVAVTGSNDDPVISGDLAISVDEGGSVMLTAADLDASDVDNLDGDLTFTVTNVNNGGILVSGNPANTFTLADITAGNVAYVHDGSEAASASIDITVDDGVGGTNTTSITATVTPVNDAPTVTTAASFQTNFTEGAGPVVVNNTIVVTDPDGGTNGPTKLTTASVGFRSNYVQGEDFLTFTDYGPFTHNFEPTTGLLVIFGDATPAEFQAALRTVQYENTSENPSTSTREMEFRASDGVTGGDSIIVTSEITITAVDTAPTITLASNPDLDGFVVNDSNAASDPDATIKLINDGTGNFTTTNQPPETRSNHVVLADIDSDGDLDAVLANFGQENRILINQGGLQGGTEGVFTNSTVLPGGSDNTIGLDVGDFDRDGDLDIIIANWRSANSEILVNQGGAQGGTEGTFTASDLPDANTGGPSGFRQSRDVALADVDGDGDLDAIIANGQSANQLYINQGGDQTGVEGTFTASDLPFVTTPASGIVSLSVEFGDIDGDGDLDALIANSGAVNEILLNNGNGGFTVSTVVGIINSSTDIALGDLDGDGDLDGIVANNSNEANELLINDGTGSFTSSTITASLGNSSDVSLVDIDGDGDLDAVISNNNFADPGQANQILINDGSANFTVTTLPGGNSGTNSTAFGDLDGDAVFNLGENIVQNGGFENAPDGAGGVTVVGTNDTTTIPHWVVTSGNVDVVTDNSAFDALEGFNHIDLNGNQPGTISQSLNTQVGETYFVSFILTVDPDVGGGTAPRLVDVSVTGEETKTFAVTPSGTRANPGFTEASFGFTATDSSTDISFESKFTGNLNSGAFLDNVQVRKVGTLTNEDAPITLSGVTLSDPDAVTALVTITTTDGTLDFASGANTSNLTTNTGSGTSSITFEGPIADIQSLVQNFIEYTPSAEFSGVSEIEITFADAAAPGNTVSETVHIGVVPVNDAPEIALDSIPATLTLEEDTSATFSGISLTDVDAGDGDIEVTLDVANGALAFTGATTGLTFADADGSDGTLIFTGSQTDINLALTSLQYTPTTDFSGTDTLNISANDLGNTGTSPATGTGTVDINVTNVNEPLTVSIGEKLVASNRGNGHALGDNVAINASGDIVSGAIGFDTAVGNEGAGYLFNANSSQPYDSSLSLSSPVESANDLFGRDVAINDNGVIAISTAGENNAQGAIIVYTPDGSGGFTSQTLVAPLSTNPQDVDFLGLSVAINNNGLVVATANGDDGAQNGAGALFVFTPDGSGGYLPGVEIFAPDAAPGDNLGDGLSVNDSGVIVVGATVGDGNVANSGTAYVFTPNSAEVTGYDSGAELVSGNGSSNDFFGNAVAINSTGTIVVGAPLDNNGEGNDAGSIYVYTSAADTSPTQIIANNGEEFGTSVAINDAGIIVAGSPGTAFNGGNGTGDADAGAIFIYRPNGSGGFLSPIRIQAPDKEGGDRFGSSVDINNDGVIVVGADADDADAGSLYTFIPNGSGGYLQSGLINVVEADTFNIETIDIANFVALSDVDDTPSIDESSITVTSRTGTDAPEADIFFNISGTEVSVDTSLFDFLNDGQTALFDITFDVVSGPETVSRTLSFEIDGVTDNAINIIDQGTLPTGTTTGSDGDINGTSNSDIIFTRGTNASDFQGDRVFGNGGNDIFIGGDIGSELFVGGDGNDTVFPGQNSGDGDYIIGSLGSDRFNFSRSFNTFNDISYGNLTATLIAIVATIDFTTNTATVEKYDNLSAPTLVGTDTLIDIKNLVGTSNGGIILRGTQQDDIFNITGSANSFIGLTAGRGNDIFNLDSGLIRLEFRVEADGINAFSRATQGANVDLNLGSNQIINDGFGFTDTISFNGDFSSGSGNVIELRGTAFDDILTGDAGDNRFIGEQGNDIIDGRAGFDTIRFDRSGAASIEIDLENNFAQGLWHNTLINYQVLNIEGVRGSNVGVDIITGSDIISNTLEGRGGVDILYSRLGADTVTGGDDVDVFRFEVTGFSSNDDVITDFNLNEDIVLVSGSSFTSTADFSITFDGTNSIADFTGGETLTFSNVDLSGLTTSEKDEFFIFNRQLISDAGGTTNGTAGNDFIQAFDGTTAFDGNGFFITDDIVRQNNVDDVINAGDGNDVILTGGSGSGYNNTGDFVDAGAGDDLIIGQSGFNVVVGGAGNDRIQGQELVYVNDLEHFSDGLNVDYSSSTSGITVNYTGGSFGGLQAQQVSDGLGGIDTIGGVTGIADSDHNDTFFVNGDDANRRSGQGGPRVFLSGGDDNVTFLNGIGQIDYINAVDGINLNISSGTVVDNNVVSSADNIGTDTFTGVNRVNGSMFDDILTGDSNNNIFRGRGGNDTIDGVGGVNRVDFFSATSRVIVDLTDSQGRGHQVYEDGHGGFDTLMNIQNITTNIGSDIIVGDGADNVLTGNAQNDLLIGGIGSDSLYGDFGGTGLDEIGVIRGGDDFLEGSEGDDFLFGGDDADVFLIKSGDGFDFIDDFNLAQGDKIDVSDFGFSNSSSITRSYNAEFDTTFFDFTGTGVSVRGDLTGLTQSQFDEYFIFNAIAGTDSVNDTLSGTAGDDYFRPVDSIEYDSIIGSTGSDTVDYVFALESFQEIGYGNLANGITFNVDSFENTASVDKGSGDSDTIRNIFNPLNSGFFGTIGGFAIIGTAQADVFNINTEAETWMSVRGDAGADTYNIQNENSGLVRLDLRNANNGVEVNLSLNSGQVINDGYGTSDTITGSGAIWEVRGSDLTDSFIGSINDESFITRWGNDTVDGGAGFDRVRYDRGVISTGVDVDLTQTTGTVTFTIPDSGGGLPTTYTQNLSNIEWIRGSNFNDTITGTTGDERLQGRNGDDTINGGGGADSIFGESGNDLIRIPDLGFEEVNGGAGQDTLELDGNFDLDLTTFEGIFPAGFEEIDLGALVSTLTINEQNVINMSDESNEFVQTNGLGVSGESLLVTGNSGDTVNLNNAGSEVGATWQLDTVNTTSGFNVYNYSNATETFATVVVEDVVAPVVT